MECWFKWDIQWKSFGDGMDVGSEIGALDLFGSYNILFIILFDKSVITLVPFI